MQNKSMKGISFCTPTISVYIIPF